MQKSRSLKIGDGLLFTALAIAIGFANAVSVIGWRQLDPANLSWLKIDPALYQTGWEFLRHEPWRVPLTWLNRLNFPFGVSAAYLDVIPLVAIPLKFLSPLLPENFQYLGLYALICLVLQTYFALRLMALFTRDRVLIVLGALFFVDSPILLWRLYGHFSLCSQWLIVAALWCYFRPINPQRTTRFLWPFALLLAISGGTSPYLSIMVLGISAAAVARTQVGLQKCEQPELPLDKGVGLRHFSDVWQMILLWLRRPLAWAGIFLVCMLLSFAFFGFLVPGSMPSISGSGYGTYSMNLLAPFNPGGAAILFKTFAVLPLQEFEGYNYLGAGVILLIIVSISRSPSILKQLWSPALRPLVVISLVFTALAVSTRVTVGQTVLATVPLPRPLIGLLAVFRSSGRFFWPAHQLITLGALVGAMTTIPKRWAVRAVVAAALLVQYFDTLPIRQGVAAQSARLASSPLKAADWWAMSRSHAHLVLAPAIQCDFVHAPGGDAAWAWFSRLAARSAMTLNSVHSARTVPESDFYNCAMLPRQIANGQLDRETAYVLSDRLARLAVTHNRTNSCRRVDGFNLCVTEKDSNPAREGRPCRQSPVVGTSVPKTCLRNLLGQ
jgi:hypothetical protein